VIVYVLDESVGMRAGLRAYAWVCTGLSHLFKGRRSETQGRYVLHKFTKANQRLPAQRTTPAASTLAVPHVGPPLLLLLLFLLPLQVSLQGPRQWGPKGTGPHKTQACAAHLMKKRGRGTGGLAPTHLLGPTALRFTRCEPAVV